MEVNEARTQLAEICKQVALYFDGWTLSKQGEAYDHRWQLMRDGMQISLSLDWRKKDRLNISTWSWPKYTRMERGEVKAETIYPNSLYDPKETSPEISVAWARGPEAIAKEIKRRFLPEYERIYARCFEKAASYQKHEDEARATWESVCAEIACDSRHNRHYVNAGGDLNLTVENRNGSIHIEGYVKTPDQLKGIIDALKGGN